MLRINTPHAPQLSFEGDVELSSGLTICSAYKHTDEISLKIREIKLNGIVVFVISAKSNHPVELLIQTAQSIWLMNFDIKKGSYHNFELSAVDTFKFSITGNAQHFIVCFEVSKINKLLVGNHKLCLENKTTGTGMTSIIGTVITQTENNSLHPVFMAAKMLELLFLGLQQTPARQQLIAIKADDMQKLEQVKSLVEENLQDPCSIIELARKVGLNDFKLKKGFKQAFGNTVFGYLLQLRMEKARQLLAHPGQTVSEVAHEVGYKNAHHFTAAFKKTFGYLPSKITRAGV